FTLQDKGQYDFIEQGGRIINSYRPRNDPVKASHPNPKSSSPGHINVTFANDAPYGVDFLLNGSGPLSRPLRLERGRHETFDVRLAPGFRPFVRVRQPDGSHQDFPLQIQDQHYRLRRTPQNRVVAVAE